MSWCQHTNGDFEEPCTRAALVAQGNPTQFWAMFWILSLICTYNNVWKDVNKEATTWSAWSMLYMQGNASTFSVEYHNKWLMFGMCFGAFVRLMAKCITNSAKLGVMIDVENLLFEIGQWDSSSVVTSSKKIPSHCMFAQLCCSLEGCFLDSSSTCVLGMKMVYPEETRQAVGEDANTLDVLTTMPLFHTMLTF